VADHNFTHAPLIESCSGRYVVRGAGGVRETVSDYWFAAEPSKQERSRVSLDFGLRRADRLLRELVVPELGRIWFVRQLSWPVAALALRAELRGVSSAKASSISHGLEALGCKLEWGDDRDGERILGKRAFGRDGDEFWRFDELRGAKHYVRNTHRQAATRALRDDGGLGLASGTRFEMMELTTAGEQLADALLDQPVGKGGRPLRKHLHAWIRGEGLDLSRTLCRALAPSSPTDAERALVQARVFGTSTDACRKRVNAAKALGLASEPRDMSEVAERLRAAGHREHADEVDAAHAFGVMIDRARDVAALVSERVAEERAGWPTDDAAKDRNVQRSLAALQKAATRYLAQADIARFDEARSRAFARALTASSGASNAAELVARAAPEVFSVADNCVRRGPLFRIVQSSAAMREAVRDAEEGADALEPDGTNQTFRLSNLHAVARDLEGKS
jgi:hypothetical protein